ncbi:MAG: transcriptional regulator GcvA [Woeseiaceae bacterium]
MRHFGLQLNALRAFEAAARLSSFSEAARELHVSHSTISHHIKGLEKSIGVPLFLRQNRRVSLTSAGEALLPVLSTSFDTISATLQTLREGRETAALRLTVTPSFANKWLVPRLRRFQAANPGVEVRLQSSLSLADFGRDKIDLGVRAGSGEWPGLKAELLMPIHMTPLCSPGLLEGSNGIATPEDLRDFTLIHADVSHDPGIESEWQEWLVSVGADGVDFSHGLSVHDPGLALQGAIDGLGIAMGYLELAAGDIAEGRLVRPLAAEVRHSWSYYTVIPIDNDADLQVSIFSDWLRAEVARS